MRKVRAAVAAILGAVAATGVCLWVFTRPMPTVGSVAEAAEPAKPGAAKSSTYMIETRQSESVTWKHKDFGVLRYYLSTIVRRTTYPDRPTEASVEFTLNDIAPEPREYGKWIVPVEQLRELLAFTKQVAEKRKDLTPDKPISGSWLYWHGTTTTGQTVTFSCSVADGKWTGISTPFDDLPGFLEKVLAHVDEVDKVKAKTPW